MTLLMGEQLQAQASPGLKTVSIVNPAPVESRITPVALPTADPGSNQWSYTLLSSDLAVPPPGFAYARQVVTAAISGQNLSGSAQTVQVRAYFNGTQFTSSLVSSLANNSYWTVQAYISPIAAGDVVGLRAWCSTGSALVNYDTIIYQVVGSRLVPLGGSWAVYAPLTIGTPAAQGSLAVSGANNGGSNTIELIDNGSDSPRTNSASSQSYTLFAAGPVNGLYKLWEADHLSTVKSNQSVNAHPQWSRPYAPDTITYRKLNVRVPV